MACVPGRRSDCGRGSRQLPALATRPCCRADRRTATRKGPVRGRTRDREDLAPAAVRRRAPGARDRADDAPHRQEAAPRTDRPPEGASRRTATGCSTGRPSRSSSRWIGVNLEPSWDHSPGHPRVGPGPLADRTRGPAPERGVARAADRDRRAFDARRPCAGHTAAAARRKGRLHGRTGGRAGRGTDRHRGPQPEGPADREYARGSQSAPSWSALIRAMFWLHEVACGSTNCRQTPPSVPAAVAGPPRSFTATPALRMLDIRGNVDTRLRKALDARGTVRRCRICARRAGTARPAR